MKRRIIMLTLSFLILSLSSCAAVSGTQEVPGDFFFCLEWGCYGDQTYDSRTGKLIKQKIATKIGDYTTTYLLSEAEKAEIFRLLRDIEFEAYPEEYEPLKGETMPARDIILTASCNGKAKTVRCMAIPLTNTPKNRKAKKFMEAYDRIVEILETSDARKALPDFEFYYN